MDTGFFGELSEPDREAILSRSRPQRFAPRSRFMYEGQVGSEVMVIVAGRVKVTYLTAEGREVILDFRGPGDLLGEIAAVDGKPRSNAVEAIEVVDVVSMPAAEFRSLLASRPTLANQLLQNTIRRFRDADRKVVEFGASNAAGRLAARLLELVERFGTSTRAGHVIDLPITQDELAGWTGASREAVAKALHGFRELGLVSTERRRLTVLDREGLQRMIAAG